MGWRRRIGTYDAILTKRTRHSPRTGTGKTFAGAKARRTNLVCARLALAVASRAFSAVLAHNAILQRASAITNGAFDAVAVGSDRAASERLKGLRIAPDNRFPIGIQIELQLAANVFH